MVVGSGEGTGYKGAVSEPEERPSDGAPLAYRVIAAVLAVLLRPLVNIDTRRLGVGTRHHTAVVVVNHRSLFDVLVGLVAFHRIRRYPRVVVASEFFERRVIGWALRAAGALPIDRADPGRFYDHARRVLDAGQPVIVMPEGKLSGDPADRTSVGAFKTGAARLALHSGAGVWALAIVGSDDVWPRDKRGPRLNPFRRRTVLLLGGAELVYVTGEVRDATEQIRTAIVELLEEAVELYPGELAAG